MFFRILKKKVSFFFLNGHFWTKKNKHNTGLGIGLDDMPSFQFGNITRNV